MKFIKVHIFLKCLWTLHHIPIRHHFWHRYLSKRFEWFEKCNLSFVFKCFPCLLSTSFCQKCCKDFCGVNICLCLLCWWSATTLKIQLTNFLISPSLVERTKHLLKLSVNGPANKLQFKKSNMTSVMGVIFNIHKFSITSQRSQTY